MLPDRLHRLRRAVFGPFEIRFAERPRARLLGLAGLAELPTRTALVVMPARSVHTWGMRFALDLVWVDGRGLPLRVDEGVAPRRLRSCRRARAVLECRAGEGRALASTLGGAWHP